MVRTPVVSSNIHSIGHEGEVLEVAFRSKNAADPMSVYRYSPVTRQTFDAIMGADSVGKAVNALVRIDGINCVKMVTEGAL